LIRYVQPLIQGELTLPKQDGLPQFVKLDALRQKPLPVGEAG
jgi:hypothetical protein